MMPETWVPEHKLFPHQVGFTCPPFDYDAAPSDFLRMCPDTVGVHRGERAPLGRPYVSRQCGHAVSHLVDCHRLDQFWVQIRQACHLGLEDLLR